jgi:aspartate kinase
MEQAIVSAVTHDTGDAKLTVTGVPDRPGVAALMFRRLAEKDINVDMIVQNVSAAGVTDISFTLPADQLETGLAIVNGLAGEIGATGVSGDSGIARVSIVGAGMKSNPGVAATMFEVLAGAGINIEMIQTSAIRLTCVVREDQAEQAVGVLHAAFGLAG